MRNLLSHITQKYIAKAVFLYKYFCKMAKLSESMSLDSSQQQLFAAKVKEMKVFNYYLIIAHRHANCNSNYCIEFAFYVFLKAIQNIQQLKN